MAQGRVLITFDSDFFDEDRQYALRSARVIILDQGRAWGMAVQALLLLPFIPDAEMWDHQKIRVQVSGEIVPFCGWRRDADDDVPIT